MCQERGKKTNRQIAGEKSSREGQWGAPLTWPVSVRMSVSLVSFLFCNCKWTPPPCPSPLFNSYQRLILDLFPRLFPSGLYILSFFSSCWLHEHRFARGNKKGVRPSRAQHSPAECCSPAPSPLLSPLSLPLSLSHIHTHTHTHTHSTHQYSASPLFLFLLIPPSLSPFYFLFPSHSVTLSLPLFFFFFFPPLCPSFEHSCIVLHALRRNIDNDSAWFPICSLLELRAWSHVNSGATVQCQNRVSPPFACRNNKAEQWRHSPHCVPFSHTHPSELCIAMHMYLPLMHIYSRGSFGYGIPFTYIDIKPLTSL